MKLDNSVRKRTSCIKGLISAMLVLCCTFLSACSKGGQRNSITIDSILTLSETVYNPFMREPYYNKSVLSMQDNGSYTNYCVQTVIAITKMHLEGDFEYAKNVIDKEMETFEKEGYFPRPSYQQFEYGWVSSMDAPVIAVASQMLYEHTGDEKYKIFVESLSEYMVKDVSEHGYVGRVGDGRWLFEYADKNTSEETAEFVLNGSLLGTLSTALIANITKNTELEKLVDEQILNYKKYACQYAFRNNEWCYYSLNKKAIQQPHYAIYEIRLLDALNEVTGDVFFQEQADLRRNMLLHYYQGFIENDNLYFLRSGAPHYYYIDVFDTQLTFLNKNNEVIKNVVLCGREIDDSLSVIEMPKGTVKIDWNVHTEYYDVHIGEITITNEPIDIDESKIDCSFRASADGAIEGEILHITPDTGKTNLVCDFLNSADIDEQTIYVVELNNKSEDEYSMSIVLYDSQDHALGRYLPNLHPGKCLIPFSLPGFVEKDDELVDLKEFDLRIYADNKQQFNIEIGDVYKFENTAEFIQYFCQSDYVPIWQ